MKAISHGFCMGVTTFFSNSNRFFACLVTQIRFSLKIIDIITEKTFYLCNSPEIICRFTNLKHLLETR